MSGLIGKKLGMTQVFTDAGELVPISVIQAGPCPVVQVKTEERHGYNAICLGFEDVPLRKVNRPMRGVFERAKVNPKRVLREFRVPNGASYVPGQILDVGTLQVGDRVQVTGTSKGKGFQGVVRRHGFKGGSKTHGQSDRTRAPGSIGGSSFPSRVFKGQRMAGHMGDRRTTVSNLAVVGVDVERHLLLIQGGVPGANGGYVLVQKG